MNYLKNVWYVAAWDAEVNADALFQRTLLDESILLFRADDGREDHRKTAPRGPPGDPTWRA